MIERVSRWQLHRRIDAVFYAVTVVWCLALLVFAVR